MTSKDSKKNSPTPEDWKTSDIVSNVLDPVLTHLVQFGQKQGIKRARVRFQDFEAEIEFPIQARLSEKEESLPRSEFNKLVTQFPDSQVQHPTSSLPPKSEGCRFETYLNNTNYKIIRSPLVGTFYRSGSPNGDPFCNIGDKISIGQALGIVEAMKLFNEIDSEVSGTVVEILVENETPVEFDQPLLVISL